MADPLTMCQTHLDRRNIEQENMDRTLETIQDLADQLTPVWGDVLEECGELENSYDDFGDWLASFLSTMAPWELASQAVEVFQCTSALGNWERLVQEIANFETRLAAERRRRDAAEQGWLNCLHHAETHGDWD